MNIFGLNIEKRNKNIQQEPVLKEGSISVYADSLLFNSFITNQISLNISTVYRAVELISDSIAILPIEILTDDNKTITGSFLNELFSTRSNNKLTKYNLIKLLIQSVILKGNGYCYIKRDLGHIKELVFLKNSDVLIVKDEKLNQIKHYICPKISNMPINVGDMIHLIKNTTNGCEGISVITYATRSLGIAQQTENTAEQYFKNGGSLAGILKVLGLVSEKLREQIKSAWNTAYSTGANGVAILPGNMDYQSIQMNVKDAQLLESRQFNVEDIARFFSVNPVMLGVTSNNSYSTIEAILTQFVFHTLMPYIQMLEEEFTRKLCPDNIKISFDENYLLRTDKQALVNYYTLLLDKGVLSIDEVREAIGYEAIGLTEHYIPFTDLAQNNLDKTNNNKDDETGE